MIGDIAISQYHYLTYNKQHFNTSLLFSVCKKTYTYMQILESERGGEKDTQGNDYYFEWTFSNLDFSE